MDGKTEQLKRTSFEFNTNVIETKRNNLMYFFLLLSNRFVYCIMLRLFSCPRNPIQYNNVNTHTHTRAQREGRDHQRSHCCIKLNAGIANMKLVNRERWIERSTVDRRVKLDWVSSLSKCNPSLFRRRINISLGPQFISIICSISTRLR